MAPAVDRPLGDDEHDLIGCARAIVRAQLRRIPSQAHQADEMLSDALWGAALACSRWDPDGGSSLRAFAWPRMKYAVIDGLRERAPVSRYEYQHGVRPVDLPAQRRDPVSLSLWTHPDDGAMAPPDPPSTDAEAYDAVDDHLLVEALLARLSTRDRFLVRRVDLEGALLRQVGDDLGISESRVCQLLARAHRRMRALGARGGEPHAA